MEVQFFIYGVPHGESIWGRVNDANYFSTFYTSCADKQKYLIQVRQAEGKTYCYYNYLVYSNIIGYDGRAGAYIGLTIRVEEAYCKDFFGVYRILDFIYNHFILGKLLKSEGDKLRFNIPNFQSAGSNIQVMEEETFRLFQLAFSTEDFISLNGFVITNGNAPTINLFDCTPDNVTATIKKFGKLAISPYYPRNKENEMQQQHSVQIQNIQQQYESKLKQQQEKSLQEKNNFDAQAKQQKAQIQQYQDEMKKKDGKLEELRRENEKNKKEMQMMGQSKKIEKLLEPIKSPIQELSRTLQQIIPEVRYEEAEAEGNSKSHRGGQRRITLLLTFLNSLLLIGVLSLVGAGYYQNKQDKETKENPVETPADNPREEIQHELENFNIDGVILDIPEHKGGKLNKNREYTVQANNPGEYAIGWIVEGAEMKGTDDKNQIKIIPNANEVKIVYIVGGKYKIREIEVK